MSSKSVKDKVNSRLRKGKKAKTSLRRACRKILRGNTIQRKKRSQNMEAKLTKKKPR